MVGLKLKKAYFDLSQTPTIIILNKVKSVFFSLNVWFHVQKHVVPAVKCKIFIFLFVVTVFGHQINLLLSGKYAPNNNSKNHNRKVLPGIYTDLSNARPWEYEQWSVHKLLKTAFLCNRRAVLESNHFFFPRSPEHLGSQDTTLYNNCSVMFLLVDSSCLLPELGLLSNISSGAIVPGASEIYIFSHSSLDPV